MKRLLGAILCLLLGAYAASAQGEALDEIEFWKLLERTNSVLREATIPELQTAAVSQLHQWWDSVRSVHVNGTDVQVDMTWLTQAKPDSLAALQAQVQAVLDYHNQLVPGANNGPLLAPLNDVLQDPRFQYDEAAPTPLPRLDLPRSSTGDIPAGLGNALLMLIGVLTAVVVIAYFVRNLRIQRAVVEKPGAESDDPTSSVDATRLATESEESQDYRSAIRYMYLSSLLLLDERGLIHYDRTLTNREHLRQVSSQPQLVSLLQPVVSTFDDVWYGFLPVDEAYYRQFCQNVEQLRQLVRR